MTSTATQTPQQPQASCKALTVKQVLDRVPFGRTTLYMGIADGWFPPGRKPRGRRFWLETEIDEFLNSWGFHKPTAE